MGIATGWDRVKQDSGADLILYVADTRTLAFTLKDKDGTALDISAWTVTFRLNSDGEVGSATNKIFEKNGTFVTDGTDGQVNLALTTSEVATADEGEDRHLYIINTAGGNQVVKAHFVVSIHPDPKAA